MVVGEKAPINVILCGNRQAGAPDRGAFPVGTFRELGARL